MKRLVSEVDCRRQVWSSVAASVLKDVCSSAEPQRFSTSYRGQLQKKSLARKVEQLRSEQRIMRPRMKSPTYPRGQRVPIFCEKPTPARHVPQPAIAAL